MCSRFNHVIAYGRISFSQLNNIPLCIWTTSFLSIRQSGHLSCFCILAIVNCAAINTEVHVSYRNLIFISFGYTFRNGIAELYGRSIFNFLSSLNIVNIKNPERWCCESAALNMPANLENSAVATGLEKVSFHSSPKERKCQRMLKLLHNCTHLRH